ncbi:hypothetical protein [endosymbiont GvMRE of Glomus versiforme]|uniref:hypothetical protein n=1 Tax=endosymbiont GvMRE of Glomus versiforme TaxID=2039283 RepID=UPI000EBAFDA3|nr:hypothetical protein [endosymbiont GvMRE of Glomus versiforme]RHZ37509.1 hypothetical protein GvMRE_I1g410 [endosymbiont GvMRE of Glomus versiforme]
MKIINKEKILETLELIENYEKNKLTYQLGEAKTQLDQLFRSVQTGLCQNNDEFTNYFTVNIYYENIVEEIEELDSIEKIGDKKEEILQRFFELYSLFLLEETKEIAKIIGINEKKEKMQELISILNLFKEGKNPLLESVYQTNKLIIDDGVQMLEVMNDSLNDVPEANSSSSNKGKQKAILKTEEENYDWIKSLSEEEKANIIIEQMIVIGQKDEKIKKLEEKITILQNQPQQQAQIIQNQPPSTLGPSN